jgi:hexosaminidase
MTKCRFIKEEMAPAVAGKDLKPGLSAEWHEYTGADCAGIEAAPVNGCYEVSEVAIPDSVSGNIGLIITGYIEVPADGIYTFALLSDDGSYLKLDGNMVVDNDKEHSPREVIGQHAMKKGLHQLYVRYFDHNGGQLRLNVFDQNGNKVNVNYKH